MALLASLQRVSDFGIYALSYRITSSTNSISEGSSITFTVSGGGQPNGTMLYYSISGNVSSSDFVDNTLTGSFTLTNNEGQVTKSLVLDGTVEPGDSFFFSVHLGSINGEVAGTSSQIYISDGTVSITPASTGVDEGSSLSFNVTTTNTPMSSFYWSITNITSSNSDFEAVSGSFNTINGSGSFSISVLADLYTDGTETFRVEVSTISTSGPIAASSVEITINDTSKSPTDESVFTTAGTYSWTAPSGVTSVSVVCIGGGGGTHACGGGGSGGSLAYGNDITVVPGNVYTVIVGAGGAGALKNGGDSSFNGTGFLKAPGGKYGVTGLSYFAGGGGGAGGYSGAGGTGGTSSGGTISYAGGASSGLGSGTAYSGGGAGGAGGNGVNTYSGSGGNGTTGVGGGGGGGISASNGVGGYTGGGGVGIYGQGTSGAGGINNGGSGGSNGIQNKGGLYGGGAGGTSNAPGGDGAVRIIWGLNRVFPATNTGTFPDAPTVGTVTISAIEATIPFTAPVFTGGGNSTIISYTAVASPGGMTATIVQSNSGSIIMSNLTPGISYTFTVYATNNIGDSAASATSNSVTASSTVNPTQVAYTTPGVYTWRVPYGVTSVSVLVVGPGGSGGSSSGSGGGGGGLAYGNNLSVTPGELITLRTGAGGVTSYFRSTTYLQASSGGSGFSGSNYSSGAGGGAAGYSGNGGNGASSGSTGTGGAGGVGSGTAMTAGYSGGAGGTRSAANLGQYQVIVGGSGGAGGGGGGGAAGQGAGPWSSLTYQSAGSGGGVGIFGQGASGAGGYQNWYSIGYGGSGGGGGGASDTSSTLRLYGSGGGGNSGTVPGSSGAVRIIWPGNERQFPSTRTADET